MPPPSATWLVRSARPGTGGNVSPITPVVANHIVLNQDLNHHQTLYGGRTAEWFIQAGLMATCRWTPPQDTVCAHLHGLGFAVPVQLGETVTFVGRAVLAGRTSILTHVDVTVGDRAIMDGFLTFVIVDDAGRPRPHGMSLDPVTELDRELQQQAREIRRQVVGR